MTNTISYDSDLRPTSITVPGVESLAFSYDAANRLTHISNGTHANYTQALGYDALGRLTSVSSGADDESYSYDADGNRTQQVVNGTATSFGYAAGSNRLMSTAGGLNASYGYNADGDTKTIDGQVAYTYGPFNHLINADGAAFSFSAAGQRLRKTFGGNTTYFAPGAGGALQAEDLNGTWYDYVWLNGRLVTVIANGGVFPLHDDQTGRPLYLTDPTSHAIDWEAKGLPFDRDTIHNSWGAFEIGFPGQYWDVEDALWHNGARDYNPWLGRYIESDPIGLAGGINTYAYVGNNPISNVDPLGLKCTAVQSALRNAARAVGNFFEGHINDTLTLDAGYVAGVEADLTVTRVGANVQLSGRIGLGFGIGFGTSVTANYTAGHPSGWGAEMSVAGGDGTGATVSGSATQGGFGGSAGVGLGALGGATLTGGYSGNIAEFRDPSITSGKSGCGCGQ